MRDGGHGSLTQRVTKDTCNRLVRSYMVCSRDNGLCLTTVARGNSLRRKRLLHVGGNRVSFSTACRKCPGTSNGLLAVRCLKGNGTLTCTHGSTTNATVSDCDRCCSVVSLTANREAHLDCRKGRLTCDNNHFSRHSIIFGRGTCFNIGARISAGTVVCVCSAGAKIMRGKTRMTNRFCFSVVHIVRGS